MRTALRKSVPAAPRVIALALCLMAPCAAASAQSDDADSPSPVLAPEIAGRIRPLDLGDSRLTRHFYTFGGGQGDLELSVDSNNLEGDIDLFVASGLRPLTKVTLYSGLYSGISRTVYLRRPETLILRVQARTPNDADGTYRIRIGGTFVAAAAPPATPAADAPQTASAAAPGAGRNTRRVSSVGARIEEPRSEVAADETKPAETEAAPAEAAPAARPTPPRRGAPRTGTNTRRTTRPETARRGSTRTPAATPRTEGGETPAATPETERPAPAESAATRAPARIRGGRSGRAGRARQPSGTRAEDRAAPEGSAAPPESSATAEPSRAGAAGLELPGTRLVLVLREGGLYVREMSDVRRVTVERGIVVVTLKTGRIERQPMANVLRMTIEP